MNRHGSKSGSCSLGSQTDKQHMKPSSIRYSLALVAAGVLALLAGMTARADYQSAVLGDGPLTYYRFSETSVITLPYPMATNLGTVGPAGNGTDMARVGDLAMVRGVPGPLNDPSSKAIWFPGTGTDNRVHVDYNSIWNTTGPFTVEIWAKPASADFVSPISSVDFSTPTRKGWVLYQSDTEQDFGNGWYFRVYNNNGNGGNATAAVNLTINLNTWYHVVGVFDGANTITLYTNGTLAATANLGGYGFRPNPLAELSIGARSDYPLHSDWEFPGSIGEPAFYTNALSAAEIALHYGMAQTNAANYSATIISNNPAGYWRLNEVVVPLPVAKNSSSAGAAFDGTYQVFSTTVPELQGPSYCGFETTNEVLHLAASPNGYVSTPALNTTMTSATFEGWVKRNGTQAGFAGITMHRNGSATHGLSFQSDGLQLAYNWNNDSATSGWNSGLTPPDGQWTYVALAVSPSQATMYMYDGTTWSSANNVMAHGPATFAAQTLIGYDSADAARHYSGRLDEAAVYNKALTVGQLRSHALAGFCDTNRPTFVTDPPLLLTVGSIYAGWPFSLSVDAYGAPPFTFQWRKNGANVSNATNMTYNVAAAAGSDSGNYDVVVTNPYGSKTNAATVAVTVVTTPPDVTTSLRTWLKFNEAAGLTAADSSGHGRDGSLQGFVSDPTQWVPGCLSNAISVNPDYYGEQQVVLVTDDGGLDFSTNREFTLAAWVNAAAAAQGANGGIIAKGFGAGQEEYCLDIDGGHYRFFVRNASSTPTILSTSVAPSGPYWQHVAAVFSSPLGIMRLYINGVEVVSAAPPSTLFTNNHEVSIGARQQFNYEGAPYDFDLVGSVDDARIYGRALLPAEVQALYSQAPIIAPSITLDPQGKSVFAGGTVTLTAAAAGTMPLNYQWYRNVTTPVAGATTATLTIASVNAGNAGDYSLTVTNTAGRTNTATATIVMFPAPANTYEGQVVADAPEAYWRLNETGGGGSISDSMGRHDGTTYSFGSPDGGANFSFAQPGALTGNPDTCIQFVTSYQNMIRVPYSAALNATNFTVECWANLASGPGADTWFAPVGSANSSMGYAIYAGGEETDWQAWLYLNPGWGVVFGPNWQLSRWTHLAMTYEGQTERLYVNGAPAGSMLRTLVQNTVAPFNIGGGANNVFAFDGLIDEVACYKTALSAARINAHYALGAYGSNSVPVFTEPPSSQTVAVGTTANFTATVVGAPTITYQWKKDGVDIPGKTDLTLSVTNAYYTDAGQYALAATNGIGGSVSLPATLTVMPAASQTNLVLRTKAGTSGSGEVMELIWPAGTLYSAPVLTGPWTVVIGATLPYYTVSPTNATMFFRRE